jgi:hypothetical protein
MIFNFKDRIHLPAVVYFGYVESHPPQGSPAFINCNKDPAIYVDKLLYYLNNKGAISERKMRQLAHV